MTADSHSEDSNTSNNPSISSLIDTRLSRRGLLRMGVGTAGAAVMGSFALTACGGGGDGDPVAGGYNLGFTAVDKSLADMATVPAGYTASIIYALGDPLTAATPAYKNDGTDTDFDNRAGDHHDGMEFFGLNAAGTARDANGSSRGLLAMNHEALSQQFLHAAGASANPRPASESDKEIPAHGVSIVEVAKNASGKFVTNQASSYNRRITPLTEVTLSGPVKGNALVKTLFSPTGMLARGTINNCGTGYTPWGSFLTGEENWAGYFTRASTDNTARGGATAKSVVSLNRYGRAAGAASRHGWETSGTADKYKRWNIGQTGVSVDGSDDYRNELNTFGYIVEIDVYDKTKAIRKRTGLGRFAHESAAFGKQTAGKPLAVYMGDDSQGEYMYKFVSTAPWAAADANPTDRIATGDKYLDSGKLYVAKFAADGSGTWIELSISNSAIAAYSTYDFADQSDVLVNARLAADAVGATKMDRPEWCAVHPVTGEVYYTLTNNSSRKLEPTGTQTMVDAANPRSYQDARIGGSLGSAGNINGHIIRMVEAGGESAATSFSWDVYLFGAEAGASASMVNLSSLASTQDFSSPDGLWFSQKSGFCYIQTDDGSYTDVTNCMMLIGKPGKVGDGSTTTLNYTKADGSAVAVTTRVGAKPTVDTLRRFLVGPVDCEITGCSETPDGKTLFVNIQHPGESITKANIADPSKYLSHWPANAGYGAGGATTARPRSATIVITKNDGGVVGT
nr:PhoX family phosphatase [uncultured Albidiferax sp.]